MDGVLPSAWLPLHRHWSIALSNDIVLLFLDFVLSLFGVRPAVDLSLNFFAFFDTGTLSDVNGFFLWILRL